MTMIREDKLVSKIFETIKQEPADCSKQRQHAIIRAGQIAQAYLGAGEDLLESVFGSGSSLAFKDDMEHCNESTR
jgi:hypothetical protein